MLAARQARESGQVDRAILEAELRELLDVAKASGSILWAQLRALELKELLLAIDAQKLRGEAEAAMAALEEEHAAELERVREEAADEEGIDGHGRKRGQRQEGGDRQGGDTAMTK